MAFWGVEIKSGKPHTLQYDDEKGRLHVSQATLGDGSSKEKTVVVCNVGDKKPIYLCSLFPKTMETCPLNVEFEEYEEVTLSVIGPHSVHLSGYFFGESPDGDENDDDSDSCEDYGLEGESESGESLDYDSEDEDELSDDDMEMFPPAPAPKSGVRIEEITDDGEPAIGNVLSKRPKKKSDDNRQKQIVLKNVASVPVLESEDEDGFPVSSPAKGGLSSKEEADEEKGTNGQLKRKKTKGDFGDTNNAKRKKDDSLKDGNQTREPSEPVNLPSATPEVVPKEDAKKAKKNKKKKKQREKEAKLQEASKSANQSEVTNNQGQAKVKLQDGVAGSVTGKKQMSKNEKEMKNKKKNKQQENTATDKKELTSEAEKAEVKSSHVRTFPNGLVIEDLQMGRPDGKRAAPGKKVSVRYIGKLKKNDKIFDSNIGKAPFKFRLGVGEVIKGWDVGVNGMRVGDKRRLTIPPAMGYGAKGAGGAIPPNAWLTFDVELVDAS